MNEGDLAGLIDFLRAAERLKTVARSGYTSAGRPESVAEHSWRVALMALVLAPQFPDVDVPRLFKICLVHDLGEAIGGDIPAPEQARRLAAGVAAGKSANERRDLLTLLEPLSPALQAEITALWDEYEAAATPEAKLAKALDKLETILQHTQGANPSGFDYRFNLGYGREHTAGHPLLVAVRAVLDEATEQRARETDAGAHVSPINTPPAMAVMSTHARGSFDVKLTPQETGMKPEEATHSRMSIEKQFHGDLEGTSEGEMLAAGTATKGSAGYVAIERVTGTLAGRTGSFTLQHTGVMNRGAPSLSVAVIPDSGTGQLVGLTGTMTIDITDGKHLYDLTYTLPAAP